MFPPSELLRSHVSTLSLNGTCATPLVFLSLKALMQFPSALRDLLMELPSCERCAQGQFRTVFNGLRGDETRQESLFTSSLLPTAPVAATLSDPARSTMFILEVISTTCNESERCEVNESSKAGPVNKQKSPVLPQLVCGPDRSLLLSPSERHRESLWCGFDSTLRLPL